MFPLAQRPKVVIQEGSEVKLLHPVRNRSPSNTRSSVNDVKLIHAERLRQPLTTNLSGNDVKLVQLLRYRQPSISNPAGRVVMLNCSRFKSPVTIIFEG